MVSESATWVGTLPYECDYDRPPFVIHRQLFAVEVPMSEWHRFRHVFSAVSRLLLAWTRVRNCKATWTVSTVSFDPGYVCMPAGLLRRVEAEYSFDPPLRSPIMLRSPDRLRPPPELRSDPAAQGARFLATCSRLLPRDQVIPETGYNQFPARAKPLLAVALQSSAQTSSQR